MSNSNNPKSFYNQADYSPDLGDTSTSNIIHKPDAADLQPPPPPYSPDGGRKSSDSNYGSTSGAPLGIDEEQQVGLLSQQAQPFPAKKKRVLAAPNPSPQQTTSSLSNPHQEMDTTPMPTFIRRPSSGFRRKSGDPGCCRKWCKYIFAGLLIWLVLLKYGNKIGLSPSPSAPISPPSHSNVCVASNVVSWEALPRVIEFERNIELVLQGAISGGRVLVTPLEDRHGGSIVSDIQFTPSSLKNDMSFEMIQQEKHTTRLVLKMPNRLNGKDCVALNMEIRVPYSADLLRIHISNVNVEIPEAFKKDVEVVDIKNANGGIELKKWSGESIDLVTANGHIKVESLKSDGYIHIENQNGDISFTSDVVAKRRVDIVSSNGLLDSIGKIEADDTVDISSISRLFQLDTVIADNVFLENANGGITVRHIEANEQVIAKTSNAPITLSVAGEKNIKVALATSNDLVNLHLTREFEGHLEISTSNGEIKIGDYKDSNIEYQDNTQHLKRGDRFGYGNKGDLTVTNSNADIFLSFDI